MDILLWYSKYDSVGDLGISINKKTKEIKLFILPSKENFEILEKAKYIALPSKYEK